jgi:hypothetical protein
MCSGFGVESFGFRVHDSGVEDSWVRVQVQGLWFIVYVLWFMVYSLVFRGQGFGFWSHGLGFGVWGLMFRSSVLQLRL